MILIVDMHQPEKYDTAGGYFALKRRIEKITGHPCVVVSYPTEGGYTPGDAYDLFLDKNDRIIQWVYRRGGAKEPTRITTWEDHRQVGPLLLALNHYGQDKNFHVWFTDVAVKTVSANTWIFPR